MLRYYLLIVAGSISISSCNNENLRKETINQKISARIVEFRNRTTKACEQKSLELAVKMADSILLANADLWQIKTDLMARPPVPVKPSAPLFKVKVDSSRVEPIFPFSHSDRK